MNVNATTLAANAGQVFSMQGFDAKLFDLIVAHANAANPSRELVLCALDTLKEKKRGGYILSDETSELLTLLEQKVATFVH